MGNVSDYTFDGLRNWFISN